MIGLQWKSKVGLYIFDLIKCCFIQCNGFFSLSRVSNVRVSVFVYGPALKSDTQAWTDHKHTQTYQVEPSHAVSGLTVLHIEEKEDVNGSQNEVEDSPSTCWTYDVGLLRHYPESCTEPVHTWRKDTPLTSVSSRKLPVCQVKKNMSLETYQRLPGSIVWRYVWRAWEQQIEIPTYWPADRENKQKINMSLIILRLL